MKWEEDEYATCLTVTSDGTSGPEWVRRLQKRFRKVDPDVRKVLRSGTLIPTVGVTYKIVVMKGTRWLNGYLTIEVVRHLITNKSLKEPNLEAACLVLEKFHSLGLFRMMIMHEPIETTSSFPTFLEAWRNGNRLNTSMTYNNMNDSLDRGYAFVFSL